MNFKTLITFLCAMLVSGHSWSNAKTDNEIKLEQTKDALEQARKHQKRDRTKICDTMDRINKPAAEVARCRNVHGPSYAYIEKLEKQITSLEEQVIEQREDNAFKDNLFLVKFNHKEIGQALSLGGDSLMTYGKSERNGGNLYSDIDVITKPDRLCKQLGFKKAYKAIIHGQLVYSNDLAQIGGGDATDDNVIDRAFYMVNDGFFNSGSRLKALDKKRDLGRDVVLLSVYKEITCAATINDAEISDDEMKTKVIIDRLAYEDQDVDGRNFDMSVESERLKELRHGEEEELETEDDLNEDREDFRQDTSASGVLYTPKTRSASQ